ncbi:MAG: 4Fe-4S dicluster domain-containing protein, partial [Thermovirgaceae bacterium]
CMRCVDNCPVGAILVESDVPVIHPEQCQSCQRCVAFCPVHAIGVPEKPAVQYRAMSFEEFTRQGSF